jgi:hypothetical protein
VAVDVVDSVLPPNELVDSHLCILPPRPDAANYDVRKNTPPQPRPDCSGQPGATSGSANDGNHRVAGVEPP